MNSRALLLTALALLATAAGCTEPNPSSCVNNPKVCRAGTSCVLSKDSEGRGVSRCVPVENAGVEERMDAANEPGRSDGGNGQLPSDLMPSGDHGGMLGEDATVGLDSGRPDSPAADVPPPVDTMGLKPNGAACAGPSECLQGNCVDNVCCDGACAGRCLSCLAANTGKANGTCSPVTSGKDPDDDCSVDAPSSCARDGWCDGTGACRLYDASTVCQAESCVDNGTTGAVHQPARKCTGTGTCSAGSPSSCGRFLCGSATRCATTCQSSSDCTSTAYCAAQTCQQKKALGAVCGKFEECGTGICGGRCCSSACTCPQPSVANLLKNAGFDKDLSDWSNDDLQWTGEDADGCPFSGSAKPLTASGDPGQCVVLAPGQSYRMGAMFKAQADGILACHMLFHATPDCTGPKFGHPTMDYPSISGRLTSWTFESASFETPPNARSGSLQCDGYNAVVDKMFVSPGDGGF
jgi:hypothetical protein